MCVSVLLSQDLLWNLLSSLVQLQGQLRVSRLEVDQKELYQFALLDLIQRDYHALSLREVVVSVADLRPNHLCTLLDRVGRLLKVRLERGLQSLEVPVGQSIQERLEVT